MTLEHGFLRNPIKNSAFTDRTNLPVWLVRWTVLVLFGILTSPAFACSCIWTSLEKSFHESDVVIEAKLRPGSATYTDSKQFGGLDRVVDVDVLRVWKGKQTDALSIRTWASTTCGYSFKKNMHIVVFASYERPQQATGDAEASEQGKDQPPLYTGYCSNNKVLSDDSQSASIVSKLDQLKDAAARSTETKKLSELRQKVRKILTESEAETPR